MLAFLTEESRLREQKRIEHLLRLSGIKRVKRLSEFDWTFNPKIPKDKIMEFVHTHWLKQPSNLVLIGPAGVGKTHLATALCYEAILQGHQTIFLASLISPPNSPKPGISTVSLTTMPKSLSSASMNWAMWSPPKNRPIGSSRSSPNAQKSRPPWSLPISSPPTGERSLIRLPPRLFWIA